MDDPLPPLLFPDSGPMPPPCLSLLLLFDRLDFYRLPVGPPALRPLPFEEEGLCRGLEPVTLPDSFRQRFQRLVQELRSQPASFYEGYLSSLSSGAAGDRDEAAAWALLSRFHHPRQAAAEAPGPELETLWQALLLLALARIYEEEQGEITARLASIESQEQQLYEQLQGTLPPRHGEPAPPGWAPAPADRLLRAWGHLFLRDPEVGRRWLLATGRPLAAETLFDRYETANGSPPPRILRLTLPAISPSSASGRLPELRQKLRQRSKGGADQVRKLLRRYVAEPDAALPGRQLAELEDHWRSQVQPTLADGTTVSLEVYALVDPGPATLVQRLCRLERQVTAPGLVALLRQPSLAP